MPNFIRMDFLERRFDHTFEDQMLYQYRKMVFPLHLKKTQCVKGQHKTNINIKLQLDFDLYANEDYKRFDRLTRVSLYLQI